jgi:hypothetical protein
MEETALRYRGTVNKQTQSCEHSEPFGSITVGEFLD